MTLLDFHVKVVFVKYGHYASDCTEPKKKHFNKKANLVSENKDKFMFQTYDNKSTSINWYLDSGATNHVCCNKEKFATLESYESTIKVGDGRALKVTGKGNIFLKVLSNKNEKKVVL